MRLPGPGAHLIVHEAHVPRVQCCDPLAAVARVHGSGQLLQRLLVVGVELVGQCQMQLLGARLHVAVCKTGQTRGCPPSAPHAQDGSAQAQHHEPPCPCPGASSARRELRPDCAISQSSPHGGAGWAPADSTRKHKGGGRRDVDFEGVWGLSVGKLGAQRVDQRIRSRRFIPWVCTLSVAWAGGRTLQVKDFCSAVVSGRNDRANATCQTGQSLRQKQFRVWCRVDLALGPSAPVGGAALA